MTILKKLKKHDGIYISDETDSVTQKVVSFYNKNPFPNYGIKDNKMSILYNGDQSYLKNLKKIFQYKKKILEVGCGTGQFSNYFAIGSNSHVFALDPTFNSLKIAKEFSDKNNIKNITYINGSIFEDNFEKESFDLIFTSGVLHHTKNAYLGFQKCLNLLKKDGLILIGLYNSYSRFSFKKILYKLFGKKIILLIDPIIKNKKFSEAAVNSWIQDQYNHPHENSFSISDVLGWFEKNNVEPIAGKPKINDQCLEQIDEHIFKSKKQKIFSKFEMVISQIKMNFNLLGTDASLFCLLGKKL